jgi:restriction endonuclease S subunit
MFHLKNPFKKKERKILKVNFSNIVTLDYNIPNSIYTINPTTYKSFDVFDSNVVTTDTYDKQKRIIFIIIFIIASIIFCFCFIICSNFKLQNEINTLKEQQNLYLKEDHKNE